MRQDGSRGNEGQELAHQFIRCRLVWCRDPAAYSAARGSLRKETQRGEERAGPPRRRVRECPRSVARRAPFLKYGNLSAGGIVRARKGCGSRTAFRRAAIRIAISDRGAEPFAPTVGAGPRGRSPEIRSGEEQSQSADLGDAGQFC